jgi:FlaA1/EpsC-like NDP-sugar epimerase
MRVLIVGAGGHARVVANTLLRMREHGSPVQPIGYVDDNPNMKGRMQIGLPVLGSLADMFTIEHDAIIVAIGNNRTRQKLFDSLAERGEQFVTVYHPSAVIAP